MQLGSWIFLTGQTSNYRKIGSYYVFSLGLLLVARLGTGVGGLGLYYHSHKPQIIEIIPEIDGYKSGPSCGLD